MVLLIEHWEKYSFSRPRIIEKHFQVNRQTGYLTFKWGTIVNVSVDFYLDVFPSRTSFIEPVEKYLWLVLTCITVKLIVLMTREYRLIIEHYFLLSLGTTIRNKQDFQIKKRSFSHRWFIIDFLFAWWNFFKWFSPSRKQWIWSLSYLFRSSLRVFCRFSFSCFTFSSSFSKWRGGDRTYRFGEGG